MPKGLSLAITCAESVRAQGHPDYGAESDATQEDTEFAARVLELVRL